MQHSQLGARQQSRVAVLSTERRDQVHINHLLNSGARVTMVARAVGLERAVEAERITCVLTELRDADGNCIRDALMRIVSRFPDLPIVVVMSMNRESVHDLVALARVARIRVAVRPYDNVAAAVLEAATCNSENPSTRAMCELLGRHVPRALRQVSYVLSDPSATALHVTDVCRRVSMPRRTINDRLRRENLPTLERLIGWSRVLHALWRLDGGHIKFEAVAKQLGFNTGSALRHMVKRYTGMTASEIYAAGGFTSALRMCECELAASELAVLGAWRYRRSRRVSVAGQH